MSFMFSEEILDELKTAISSVNQEDVSKLEEALQKADCVFCDGLGRSGLSCRAFAMRLMHLGITSYCVGDTVTPAIKENDLLLLCSGSGESEALISHARKAKKNGAGVALITGNRNSTLGELADIQVEISAPKKDAERKDRETILPMGSLFEGASSLLFENLVLELMEKRNETSQTMFQRHANLE